MPINGNRKTLAESVPRKPETLTVIPNTLEAEAGGLRVWVNLGYIAKNSNSKVKEANIGGQKNSLAEDSFPSYPSPKPWGRTCW